MVKRLLKPAEKNSFLLFGARGTGKSTFLREWFSGKNVLWLDLLRPDEEDMYARRPQLLSERLSGMKNLPDAVVIDEVQKVPRLLDVAHSEIENRGVVFALSGSSARKLKRGGVNLLAGRAFVYSMFPFTSAELGRDFDLDSALSYGTLPGLLRFRKNSDKREFLTAYALTYLKEEVWGEQLVRNLNPFRAFLEVAAQSNGELINYSNIARDVGVDIKTVQSYFQILEDTLLGYMLEPYHSSVRKRQSRAPKFYFFDTGVCRALSRSLTVPLRKNTYAYGRAFEHFVITELFRRNEYLHADFRFFYLRTRDGVEADVVIERPGRKTLLVEIKSSASGDERDAKGIRMLLKDMPGAQGICLSRDTSARVAEGIRMLPWQDGLKEIGLEARV